MTAMDVLRRILAIILEFFSATEPETQDRVLAVGNRPLTVGGRSLRIKQ